jgi:hypothetical protein
MTEIGGPDRVPGLDLARFERFLAEALPGVVTGPLSARVIRAANLISHTR